VDTKTEPRDQVAAMDAATFFTRLATLLPRTRRRRKTRRGRKMKKLGIVAGKPFDARQARCAAATSVNEGARSARDQIVMAGKGPGSADVAQRLAHRPRHRTLGVDYGKRAVAAGAASA
jgi:uncharacterized protein (UPF0371 family)